jgi:hypothetical protein
MSFFGVQYVLPAKINFGLNAGGSTAEPQLQGKGYKWYFYSFSFSRSFLKDRLTVAADFSNPFTAHQKFKQTTSSSNFISTMSTHYPSRYINFSVSYRLGDLKATVKKAERSIQNDDVKGGDASPGQGAGGGASQGGKQ